MEQYGLECWCAEMRISHTGALADVGEGARLYFPRMVAPHPTYASCAVDLTHLRWVVRSGLAFLELCRTYETALINRLRHRWFQRARSGEEMQPSLTWDVHLVALSWPEERPVHVRKIMWRDHTESQSVCPGCSTSWCPGLPRPGTSIWNLLEEFSLLDTLSDVEWIRDECSHRSLLCTPNSAANCYILKPWCLGWLIMWSP